MAGLRFGLIGCGAISEALYLPALSKARSICSELHLMDTQPGRLAAMSEDYGAASRTTSLQDLINRVDVAVVATPPRTHFPIARSLIAAGKHVFCEKPMTISPTDAEELVSLAATSNVILMVNHNRRIATAMSHIQKMIRSEELGRLLSVSWVEGHKPSWPTQSGYYFTQHMQDGLPGAGVLLDMGAHIVDLLCWWLGEMPRVIGCRTDSYGGPDSRAHLHLDFDGMSTRMDLGSYVRMNNIYTLEFERGTISGHTGDASRFQVQRRGAEPSRVDCGKSETWLSVLLNFAAVVNGRERPIVTGRDVLPSIRTIAEGYRMAQPFDEPWLPKWAQL
jgi:predicted dehydrogenase